MRLYETTIINKINVDDSTYADLVARTVKTINGSGGEVVINDKWGNRRMAYPMNDESNGCYTYLAYTAGEGVVAEIERHFRNQEYILRFLTVKVADQGNYDLDAFKKEYLEANWKDKSNVATAWNKEKKEARDAGPKDRRDFREPRERSDRGDRDRDQRDRGDRGDRGERSDRGDRYRD